MAKLLGKVYLGYEDESINEKTQFLLDYTINKIGGFPDLPPKSNLKLNSKCPLCGLYRLFLVQCYAPLENSLYHRTLYIFACISPNCWNQSESWSCIRTQHKCEATLNSISVDLPRSDTNMTWCNGADEWDENDNEDSENGNIMNVDNACAVQNLQKYSDEDDESNSFEIETVEQALGNLQVYDAHNANMSPVQGAVGAIAAPVAAAELEGGDEPGLVSVDSPSLPSNDLDALLHQPAELPGDLRCRLINGPLQFASRFIYVEEEIRKSNKLYGDDKVTELLNKYKKENDMDSPVIGGDRAAGGGGEDETYEEATPLHGDKLFHAFITRIKENPGQILRYSRDEPPLLGAPINSAVQSPTGTVPTLCTRCGSRLFCELQLLPAFADLLRVLPGNIQLPHLHFLSVLVFTCSQSCWNASDTIVNETVVFQPEI